MTRQEFLKAEFLKKQGVTKCPPGRACGASEVHKGLGKRGLTTWHVMEVSAGETVPPVPRRGVKR